MQDLFIEYARRASAEFIAAAQAKSRDDRVAHRAEAEKYVRLIGEYEKRLYNA